MFDRTQRGASPRRSRWRDFRDEHRILSVIIVVVGIIAILIGGHLYGRYLSSVDLVEREAQIEQLRSESQKQKRDIDSKSQQITQLQTKLTKTQAALDAILPSANTYHIAPNQTLILDQHVTVGLIGTPGNESVLLNINGKPQTVAVGQTVSVSPDPATKCQIVVQSFDVFKAVLVASCSAANAR